MTYQLFIVNFSRGIPLLEKKPKNKSWGYMKTNACPPNICLRSQRNGCAYSWQVVWNL